MAQSGEGSSTFATERQSLAPFRQMSLRSFFDANKRLKKLNLLRHLGEYGVHVEYIRLATCLLSAPDVSRVLDIAAGSNWQFPLEYKSAFGLHLTGLDIDSDAVQSNPFLDEALVLDVCREALPRPDYFDLILCYSGIEHFSDVRAFLAHGFDGLRPGGAMIAQFPSSLAPFALLNRLLPQGVKRLALGLAFPEKTQEIGYKAYYDKCRYSEFRTAAKQAGFEVEYYLPSFLSSDYFSFFVPLYWLSSCIDFVRLLFGTRDMASYNLFVLRKPGPHHRIKWSWHDIEY